MDGWDGMGLDVGWDGMDGWMDRMDGWIVCLFVCLFGQVLIKCENDSLCRHVAIEIGYSVTLKTVI